MSISGKKYRLKSRRRFTIFIAMIMVIGVMISNTFLGLNDVSSMTKKNYIEIEVQHGDTLWDLAREYMHENKDIRRAVYTLRQVNGIAAHELKAGQTILIPID